MYWKLFPSQRLFVVQNTLIGNIVALKIDVDAHIYSEDNNENGNTISETRDSQGISARFQPNRFCED